MAKRWTKVLHSLPHSRKVRELDNIADKWAYMCILVSTMGNYHGQFFFPAQMLAIDMPCDIDAARDVIRRLEDVGLVEYDDREQFIRICAWHLKANAPENPSTVTTRARELVTLSGPVGMTRRTIAEFLVAAFRACEGWRPDTKPFAEMEQQINKTMQQVLRVHGAALVKDMIAAGLSETDERLFSEMQLRVDDFDTVFARCAHSARILDLDLDLDGEKTETERETETETERETARSTGRRVVAEPTPAPTKSRNGTGKPAPAPERSLQAEVMSQVSTRGGVPGHQWVDDASLADMVSAGDLGQSTVTAYKRLRREATQ